MKHIYIKDADGRKVIVEVTEEVAQAYRESLREEWRGDAKERYHTISLGVIADAGHEFADGDEGIEDVLIREEDNVAKQVLFKKLRDALQSLAPLQKKTLYKVYVLHMSQSEVAREEGVARQIVSKRLIRIHKRLKKVWKKFEFFQKKWVTKVGFFSDR